MGALLIPFTLALPFLPFALINEIIFVPIIEFFSNIF